MSYKLNINPRKAQVTIFIIIAILIFAVIALYFLLRGNAVTSTTPKEFEPVYSYYLSCLKDSATTGASLLGQQGGYIETPEFSPGSTYMPFSNQLDFLGRGIPYWYYITGNGIITEQKPTLEKMQAQLDDYIKQNIKTCDFSKFFDAGYLVFLGDPKVSTKIENNKITVDVNQDLTLKYGDSSFDVSTSTFTVNSNLGKFYSIADKIYNNQKDTMFLENYGVDILRLYAPVDGSDLTCSPKLWSVNQIRQNLTTALVANVPEVKIKGNYYTLAKPDNKYYVKDVGINSDVNVNFMYQSNFPMKLEVWPSDNNILRADPVGLQQGLGILGFCYVPYHFVYDFAYPVLVQIYSGDEMFQFPVVVSIVKNKPREALPSEALPSVVPDLCNHMNSTISVYTYDSHLNPLTADIKFKCFDTTCDIGQTVLSSDSVDSVLVGKFPQCVNGFIIASKDGYSSSQYQVSSLSESNANIILNKKYKLKVEVDKLGIKTNDYAIVTFQNNDTMDTISYPQQTEVELTEGQYQVKTYVYSNSSIDLKGSTSQKCIDVPQNSILGIFGATEQKCINVNIPSQVITNAVSGGGTSNYYMTETELENSNKIVINTQYFGLPKKIEDLQGNYNDVEVTQLDITFENETTTK